MGIKGLTKFISDHAPRAIRQQDFGALGSRIVAIDASMSLYQFMIAIRDSGSQMALTNSAGEATSHISGFLSRVVRLLENNIQPVYVFDGKPPTLKSGELAKRSERREAAEAGLKEAVEKGDQEEVKKFVGRTVKVTREQNLDVQKLLGLLGCPIVQAPCEAEAQCAILCQEGLAYATGTEDADALCFGTPVLVRHLNFSEAKAKDNPLLMIDLSVALTDLELTMDQFIDFCILCGCDYTDTIKGVGPGTAYKWIKEYKNIETMLQNIDPKRYVVPVPFPYIEAREFFKNPEVQRGTEPFTWNTPDYEALKTFLIDQNDFNATRVESMIARLKKVRSGGSQQRLDSFFTIKKTSAPPAQAKAKAAGKRAIGEKAGAKKKQKK